MTAIPVPAGSESFLDYHARILAGVQSRRVAAETAASGRASRPDPYARHADQREATAKQVIEEPGDLELPFIDITPRPSPGFDRLDSLMDGRWAEDYGVERGMWYGPPLPKEMVAEVLEGLEGTEMHWQAGWPYE